MSPGSISSLSESDEPGSSAFISNPMRRRRKSATGAARSCTISMATPGAELRARTTCARRFSTKGTAYKYSVTLEPSSERWWFALDTVTETPDRRRVAPDVRSAARWRTSRSRGSSRITPSRTRKRGPKRPVPLIARRVDTRLPPNRNPCARWRWRGDARTRWRPDQQYIASVLDLFRRGRLRDIADTSASEPGLGRRLHFQHEARVLRPLRFRLRHADACGWTFPSRVVTGYQGGEWNPIRQYYLIRQSDAHAWAEWARPGAAGRASTPRPSSLRRDHGGACSISCPTPAPLPRACFVEVTWIASLRQTWDAGQRLVERARGAFRFPYAAGSASLAGLRRAGLADSRIPALRRDSSRGCS